MDDEEWKWYNSQIEWAIDMFQMHLDGLKKLANSKLRIHNPSKFREEVKTQAEIIISSLDYLVIDVHNIEHELTNVVHLDKVTCRELEILKFPVRRIVE